MKFDEIVKEIAVCENKKNEFCIGPKNIYNGFTYQDFLEHSDINYIDLLYGDMEGLYFVCDEGIGWIPYYLPIPYFVASLDMDKAVIIDEELLLIPLIEFSKVIKEYTDMLNEIGYNVWKLRNL